MSSIQKTSLDSKTDSKPTNLTNHQCELCHNYFGKCKCYRNMFKNCCLLLKIMIMLIVGYILYNIITNNNQSINSFKLVRRY